jgi:glycosyltransferase involved in cell wall biosynthesis
LLTFALTAFNQEPFIREAVGASLAQTYSPLEIILSDDCSRDRTFEIMREMAAAYRGPHRVILNRNATRRSIGGHMNRVMEISHGELVVGAAGDDISLPQRAEAAYRAWESSGRKATSIHSNFIQIDEAGQTIEQIYKTADDGQTGSPVEQKVDPLAYVRTLEPIVFGCAHAFSRQLFRVFGPLPEEVIHEDNALAFRSILIGKLVYINKPLVKYRLHGANAYVRSKSRTLDLKVLAKQENRLWQDFKNRETMYKGFLLDLETAINQSLIENTAFEDLQAEAAKMRRRFSMQRQFLESGLVGKCRILSRLRKEGLKGTEFKALARRLVPRPLLLGLRFARSYAAMTSAQST